MPEPVNTNSEKDPNEPAAPTGEPAAEPVTGFPSDPDPDFPTPEYHAFGEAVEPGEDAEPSEDNSNDSESDQL